MNNIPPTGHTLVSSTLPTRSVGRKALSSVSFSSHVRFSNDSLKNHTDITLMRPAGINAKLNICTIMFSIKGINHFPAGQRIAFSCGHMLFNSHRLLVMYICYIVIAPWSNSYTIICDVGKDCNNTRGSIWKSVLPVIWKGCVACPASADVVCWIKYLLSYQLFVSPSSRDLKTI